MLILVFISQCHFLTECDDMEYFYLKNTQQICQNGNGSDKQGSGTEPALIQTGNSLGVSHSGLYID